MKSPACSIVSDHGVEGRCPFLDEEVVSYLNQLNVVDKCDLRLPRGLGEKLLLRAVAFKLGLRKVDLRYTIYQLEASSVLK